MKQIVLMAVLLLGLAACSNTPKYNETDLLGLWVEPIQGQVGVQGIALEENGKARSINMETLRYDSWLLDNDKLILCGTSIGNKVSNRFCDTLDIARLSADTLQLLRKDSHINYIRSKEECGFSANQGEIRSGIITIAHEVRTFQPENSDTIYWLVDKSDYLLQRLIESGLPEWQVKAELEVKNIGKIEDGFAAEYLAAYQLLRILKMEE